MIAPYGGQEPGKGHWFDGASRAIRTAVRTTHSRQAGAGLTGTEESMQRVGSAGRSVPPLGRLSRRATAAAVVTAALTALSACTSGGGGTASSPANNSSAARGSTAPGSQSSSSAVVGEAVITTTPAAGAKRVNPANPVTVKVADGTLTSVIMKNPVGKTVSGTIDANGTSWQTTEDLGYSKTYRLTATAKDQSGKTVSKRSTLTTVTPDNMTMPYFKTIYGSGMHNKATYGVGMVAVVQFDEPIPNKAKAEKALEVTTSPHVDGAWYWTDDHTAHWRPRHFYTPGTKVSMKANAYGVDFGHGLYGQDDAHTSFTIGAKHLAVANGKTHHVKVYFNDKLVRNMPTSMGQGGYTTGKFGQISLWTMRGVYTVINFENPATMSSDSYGLPANSPLGYAPEKVPYAVKLSTDGIYLHELDTTVGYQGHSNVSHGCMNLNYSNAKWYFNHSVIGDPVKVVKSGGPLIDVNQGGDWSVAWSTWVKGNH